MQRRCDACGAEYLAQTARSRFCGSTCRSRAFRGRVEPASSAPREVFGDISRAVLARLTELGQQDSPRGLAVQILTRHADANAEHGGPSRDLVALVRQISRSMADIEAQAGRVAPTPLLDEIAARRARRTAARRPKGFL